MGEPALQLYPVDYPETDGKPMAETDLHRDEMADTIGLLKHRYRGAPRTYVAGNLLVYYEEGNPSACFAPDVFVVFDTHKRRRRIYKLWEEKRVPSFVLEVTSRGTRLEDKGSKRELCAELGVSEYFLFDPEADYLKPPLQGFRLQGDAYEPLAADAAGRLRSDVIGLLLTRDEEGRLRFVDPSTGERVLRVEERADREAERADHEAERAKREAERAKREAARAKHEAARAKREAARAATAEAEVARLRALLEKKKK
jgi:Uma2 family endonuclease